jgi:hypothetical protein
VKELGVAQVHGAAPRAKFPHDTNEPKRVPCVRARSGRMQSHRAGGGHQQQHCVREFKSQPAGRFTSGQALFFTSHRHSSTADIHSVGSSQGDACSRCRTQPHGRLRGQDLPVTLWCGDWGVLFSTRQWCCYCIQRLARPNILGLLMSYNKVNIHHRI